MGNLLNSYHPDGEWTKTRMIKKYSVQGNTHEISDIKKQMDEAAEWLQSTLVSLVEVPEEPEEPEEKTEGPEIVELPELTQLTEDQILELDMELQYRVSYLLGDNSDWLQETDLYMQFSKDFRATYNINTFDW